MTDDAKPGPGPRCGIERAKRVLDESGREVVDMLLADYEQHGWTDSDIGAAINVLIKDRDCDDISTSIVKWHRQRECRCRKAAA